MRSDSALLGAGYVNYQQSAHTPDLFLLEVPKGLYWALIENSGDLALEALDLRIRR